MNRIKFPKNTAIERIIAKDKVLKQVNASEPLKRIFAQQVDRIRCMNEITADKLNISASDQVPKIFIIQVQAKGHEINESVIETIDKAFQVPVLFELLTDDAKQYACAYRRRSESDTSKWVYSPYFYSQHLDDTILLDMPITLGIENLYHKLIQYILPYQVRQNESLSMHIERVKQIKTLQMQCSNMEQKINTEKQFNRRVDLNKRHKALMAELNELEKI